MKLAALFGDHAVVQRDCSVPVWGWTRPRLRVTVTLGAYQADTVAGADGRFLARLPPMPAGGPFALEVRTTDPAERAAATDVWVGEVWICSGQSNMEWTLAQVGARGERDAAQSGLTGLRMFSVPRVAQAGRQTDPGAAWQVCRPETAGGFSAIGYYFGRKLHEALGVAVGMLNTSWGGTRIEAWMSREALVEDAEARPEVERYEATVHSPEFWATLGECDLADPAQRQAYLQTVSSYPADPGIAAEARGWAAAGLDDRAWPTMQLPTKWQGAGVPGSGILWFRREVEIPAGWAGRDLALGLGAVDKTDITFFNGEQVGATGAGFDESVWNVPRAYRVPGRLVKAGRNVIAVRAYSFAFDGGMIGPADRMHLAPAEGGARPIALTGPWRYAAEKSFGLVQPAAIPFGPGNPNSPYILYENMLAPLLPYALRGALWYQGESNARPSAASYGRLLAAMIRDWRRAWGQGDFAFLTVQLANYTTPTVHDPASTWALVREGQARSLELPETGLAVAIDIGEANDIHPKNKEEVGRRLAQWALTRTYGRSGVPSGPLFAGATVAGDRIRVRFRHAGGGLAARDGALRTLAIAGENRTFVPAQAVIEPATNPGGPADTVVVSSPEVARPMAVRYAWADNPGGANLYNVEGYPASPFRTDAW